MKKIEITKNSTLGRALRKALKAGRGISVPGDLAPLAEYRTALEDLAHALVQQARRDGW